MPVKTATFSRILAVQLVMIGRTWAGERRRSLAISRIELVVLIYDVGINHVILGERRSDVREASDDSLRAFAAEEIVHTRARTNLAAWRYNVP
jgi:hypothetical protein